jgi:hypothetical protein
MWHCVNCPFGGTYWLDLQGSRTALEINARRSFEMSVNNYQSVRRHISEAFTLPVPNIVLCAHMCVCVRHTSFLSKHCLAESRGTTGI